MAASQPLPTHPISNWSGPWTFWDNIVTRTGHQVCYGTVVPLVNIVALPVIDGVNTMIASVTGYSKENVAALVSRVSLAIPRLLYGMAYRLLHQTNASFLAMADIDSLNKLVTFIIGLSELSLGKSHPFVKSLKSANIAVGGLIVGKHFVSFAKLDILNLMKDGSINVGQFCKTLYAFMFQMSHVCQTLGYLQDVGCLNLAPVAAAIGNGIPVLKPFIGKCVSLGLSGAKSRLVVWASLVAVASVFEFGYSKWKNFLVKRPEGTLAEFLDLGKVAEQINDKKLKDKITFTDLEEDDQSCTFFNSIAKAYVVYCTSYGSWCLNDLLLNLLANGVLGPTNEHKGAGNILKEFDKGLLLKEQMVTVVEKAVLGQPLNLKGEFAKRGTRQSLAEHYFYVAGG